MTSSVRMGARQTLTPDAVMAQDVDGAAENWVILLQSDPQEAFAQIVTFVLRVRGDVQP